MFNQAKAHKARQYKVFLLQRLPHGLEIMRFGIRQGTKITLPQLEPKLLQLQSEKLTQLAQIEPI
jgi:hypothetical protein